MKYLRLFDTHADYLDFTETLEFILPNVSRCRASNDVHYNPIPETRLIVTYNIESNSGGGGRARAESTLKSTSTSTVSAKIMNYFDKVQYEAEYGEGSSPFTKDIKAVNIFDKIEWNGTEINPSELDAAYGYWSLPTGTLVIKYTLSDPTTIPYGLFSNYNYYNGGGAAKGETRSLGQQSSIIKVEIPNNVTTIEGMAFAGNTDLTTIKFGTGIETINDYVFCSCGNGNHFDNATWQTIEEFFLAEIASFAIFSCPSSGGSVEAVNSSPD